MKTVTFDETKCKLVPVEPTQEMVMAGIHVLPNETTPAHWWISFPKEAYQAMLAAAPSQEQVVQGEHLIYEDGSPGPLYPSKEPVTLTDAVKALDDLQSAFMSHTQWNGTPPSEVIAARAIIAALREKEGK